jgi:hypothetical protein
MTNSVLIKTNFKGTIAESILSEIENKTSRFHYFFGRPESWDLDYSPFVATDSLHNEFATRGDMVYTKQIASTDVCLVAKRIDWIPNTVYDRYDDEYSTELIGINLTFGGSGYTSTPTVVIGGTGTGAAATATISNATGKVTGVTVTSRGTGYLKSTQNPLTISFSGGGGTGATAVGVLINGQGNTTRLEDTQYYVMTDDFNVYVCLMNNHGGQSTVKPYGTDSSALSLSDGYVWKYLYTVPIALRNRFLTTSYIPVATSLRAQFYNAGAIDKIRIDSAGTGYTGVTEVSVSGDGFLSNNPRFVTSAVVTTGGSGYGSATATFDPPFTNVTTWAATRLFLQGQKVSYLKNYYEVTTTGTSTSTPPTHTNGTVTLGAAFKYIGTIAEANLGVSGGAVNSVTLKQGIRSILVTNGGTGYANGPNTVVFSSGSATAVSYAQNGIIYRVDITDPAINSYTTLPTITSFGGGGTGAVGTVLGQTGWGYSSTPLIAVSGGTGAVVTATSIKSEAIIYPLINAGNIIGTQIVDGGVGYSTVSLTVTGNGTGAQLSADLYIGDITTLQSNTELAAVDGAIHNIQVVSGGYGYTTAPSVTIIGDGTGAVATATVSGGVVTGFLVPSIGSGYRKAKIIISGGGGSGAVARAIIAPHGGHGRNVVRALNSRALMFQTNISKDKISGFNLGTAYRQFGIIRNLLAYGTSSVYSGGIGSACWVITATSSISGGFTPGAILDVVPITGSTSTTVSSVSTSTSFTVASVTGIAVGNAVAGSGVVSGTLVTDITGNTITVSTPISGITNGTALRFNWPVQYRLIYVTTEEAIIQSVDNAVPSVGETFNFSGNTFVALAITSPSVDKYSGDLLYQDNNVPFTPVDNTSEKITISTVIKF